MNNTQKLNMMKIIYKNNDLLTPDEVCHVLGGITRKTLVYWCNKHRHKKLLAPIRFSARNVRYEYQNVMAFKEQCRAVY